MRIHLGIFFAATVLAGWPIWAPVSAVSQTVAPITNGNASTNALGDLSRFRAIAADTLKIVKAGDLATAKAKIRDLEKSWDDAEPTLRPSNQVVWKRIDKSIDNALVELRADTPIARGCSEALENLLTEMDKVSKKM